jgi:hypothetical protein
MPDKTNGFVDITATGYSAVFDWINSHALPNNAVLRL